MNEPEFFEWMVSYKRRFLGPNDHDAFVLTWKERILHRELGDMLAAIEDVALDSRDEARFPRQHLRLLVEHADERKRRRVAGWADPFAGKACPARSEEWNRMLLQQKLITKKEFEKRAKENAT